MLGVFGELAAYFNPSVSPRADTVVFKLHYKVTVAIMTGACILNCLTNFFGKYRNEPPNRLRPRD
jgi:hypothetical protein